MKHSPRSLWGVTDFFRYDAMPSQRHLVYNAVLVNEQTRCAISDERPKSEVQAKGTCIAKILDSVHILIFLQIHQGVSRTCE